MAEKLVVELNNIYLETNRGIQLFNNLSFRLQAGRSAVITGPASSGKTSLIKLLVGLRSAQSGSVELFGECLKRGRIRATKRVRRRIGGVGGIFALIPSFTVAENITLPLIITGQRRKVRHERLLKMLTEFSLLNRAGDYPRSLTRVESTLAQFARASIAHQPLMVVDEPLAGFDRKTHERIFEHLVRVSLSGRSMIILCSEIPSQQLPNTDCYQLAEGALS